MLRVCLVVVLIACVFAVSTIELNSTQVLYNLLLKILSKSNNFFKYHI